MDPQRVLPDFRTLVIASFIFFTAMAYIGFDMKDIVYKKASALFGIQPSAAVSDDAPVIHRTVNEVYDDGQTLRDGNRIFLSKNADNGGHNVAPFSVNSHAPLKQCTPSVSKLLDSRGSKNAIQVIPSSSGVNYGSTLVVA